MATNPLSPRKQICIKTGFVLLKEQEWSLALSGEQGRLYCPHNTDAEMEALRGKLMGTQFVLGLGLVDLWDSFLCSAPNASAREGDWATSPPCRIWA